VYVGQLSGESASEESLVFKDLLLELLMEDAGKLLGNSFVIIKNEVKNKITPMITPFFGIIKFKLNPEIKKVDQNAFLLLN
jgi:hypothetical protein